MGLIEDMREDGIEHSVETIDTLLAFLRCGLAALQERDRSLARVHPAAA